MEKRDVADPSFAVVVPVYNKERHAARAMQSILAQSDPPDEIIIIDDASSDDSIPILRAHANERVVFLERSEPGPGGYAARNLGIETARSEWIAFLDADDVWTPDHLATMKAAIRRAGAGPACVFAGYEYLEPSGLRVKDWFCASHRDHAVYSTERMLDEWLAGGCPIWTGAVAIRRDTLLDTGMFPAGLCRRGGDRDLWLRTILATSCIYTGAVTATYHRDADNMLTRVEVFTTRQRMLDTIEEELPAAPHGVARRLKRIFNREVFKYVFKAWKDGARITRPMTEGFFTTLSPIKYTSIKLMTWLPFPISQEIRRHVRESRAAFRKRRQDFQRG